MLVISNLTKRYDEIVALDDLSMSVRPGRILGFLGPNGAGKTTTMRSVFGLVTPDTGEITWNDSRVDAASWSQFGYMPEERGLYPKMRVFEQLHHFARLAGLDSATATENIDRWLAQLGLTDRARSKLEELSHGNQQRVQLAAALVHEPAVAILDEPFSGLDPLAVDDLAAVLAKLAADGTAILFSSHQLDLVQSVCQDVVIIDHGRVVLEGEVERLRDDSEQRVLEIDVDGRPFVSERATRANGGRALIDRDTPITDIVTEAQAHGTITSLRFEPPNLSDLFRQAVRR
ncbi:MAG: ATP-binding cassette domain-containing protein [Acidimicrobiia bacterium]|nr:ATP-binding cassette domain-containing protein [Acidimicrobiia bacterium]